MVQPYWDYELPQAGAARDAGDDAVDELARLLRQAVARRAGPGIALPLTGGLDSRLLAGLLHEQAPDLEVVTATVGHEHANDVRFARQLAATLGYPHTFVPIGPTYIADHAEAGLVAQEGAASCSTFWILAMNDVFEPAGTAVAWSGFLGGQLAGAHLPRRVSVTTPPDAALEALWRSKYAHYCSDAELSRLLKPHVYADVRGEAFASVQRSFIAAATDDALSRCMYVELRPKQRRYTSGHRELLGLACRPVEPFADNGLVDFVLSLPKQPMVDQRQYRRMIVRHLPTLAEVPYAKTGAPVDASRVRYWSRRAARRARAEIAARLPSGAEWVHDKQGLRPLRRVGPRRLAPLRRGRPPPRVPRGPVRGRRGQRAGRRPHGGQGRPVPQLFALATFALWRRATGINFGPLKHRRLGDGDDEPAAARPVRLLLGEDLVGEVPGQQQYVVRHVLDQRSGAAIGRCTPGM